MSVIDHIDLAALESWLVEQRWFASKTRTVSALRILEAAPLDDEPEPQMVLAIVEVAFGAGTHELYQVPLGLRHVDEGWSEGVVCTAGDRTVYDALVDPVLTRRLVRALRGEARTYEAADEAEWRFHAVGALPADDELDPIRPVGVEQSNSSTVFGSDLILKVYRRLEPGPNPELEVLRYLTEQGFASIARLRGWYEHNGRLVDATLGLAQEFVASRGDGWGLVVDALAEGRGDAVLEDLADLGRVTAQMHTTLGSGGGDPIFAPEEPSVEGLSLLLATIDEDIERMFRDLPELDALEPIAGRGPEVREKVRGLSNSGADGRVIRTHGDYHLGQCLRTDRGWVVLDFEGEPARSLPERRQKRSPLRDVAGMLRSFSYAASAVELQRGTPAPEGWEERARAVYLDAYFEAIDARLLPPGRQNSERILSIFELEKAVYELRYELDNRPDWVRIPVAGIARLLETEEDPA